MYSTAPLLPLIRIFPNPLISPAIFHSTQYKLASLKYSPSAIVLCCLVGQVPAKIKGTTDVTDLENACTHGTVRCRLLTGSAELDDLAPLGDGVVPVGLL